MTIFREPSVVTFLFTDIVGSTQLHDALGDEAAQEIVRIHNQIVRREVQRHGGSEVKTMGDGFMIAFRSVTSALSCAVSIQRAIGQHNEEQPTLEFMVRMGLNAGEAIEEEEDFFGTAVIVAARIAALAEGGEILTSAAVKQLAQGMRGIDYQPRGEFQLKGLRESHHVYQVISAFADRPQRAALRRSRFVGRESEMASLKDSLEQTATGPGVFVLVSGEPGVGKTRLAEEFTRYAKTRGFRAYRGRCYGTEGSPLYAPFVEILRDYIQERSEEALEDELGDHVEEIARLVPEVARRIPVRNAGIPLPPEQERYRVLEAVRWLFEQIAHRRPLLLILEDLQWADAASALVLRHLAPSLTDVPLMILGTCARDSLEATDAVFSAVAEFGRLQIYRRVRLTGLGTSEIQEMLLGLGSGHAPSSFVEAVRDETEGNPFFVTELVNHLASEGALLDDGGEWRRDFSPHSLNMPESVRMVIQRRLDTLGEVTRRVLTLAAVAGRDFTYDLLEAMEEVPPESLLDGLDEAIRMGMIEEVEHDATRFRFSHLLTRQTLYDQLTRLRQQRFHLRVAESMDQMGGWEPEDIANHLLRAGNMAPPEKTRRYLSMAGDKARRMAAWEAAAEYFAQALELIAGDHEEERAGLLRRLGEAESGKGNWEAAVANLNGAMSLFESLGDTETVAWIAYSLRRLYGARGQFAEASGVVEKGLRALGDADSEVRSRLLAQAAFIRSAFGESAEAERLLSQSTQTAERLDSPAARGFAAFIRGMHHLNYTRLAEAADWLKRAAQWSLEGEDPWSASQASSFRRHILFTLGDLAEAERSMEEEERLARKAGNFLAACETKWISSGVSCLRGDLPRAEGLGEELLDLIEASQADSGIPGALINLAYIRFLRGDVDAFEGLLSRATNAYDRMSAAPIDDPWPVLLLLRALSGRIEQARGMLPGLKRYFDFRAPWTTSLGEARTTMAAALGVLGDGQAAGELYGPLRAWTDDAGYVLTGASSIPQLVSRALAMAASAALLQAEAVTHFEMALRQARDVGATTELAETAYWYAFHLLDRTPSGDTEYGLDLLAEARRLWERAGMTGQVERANALVDRARSA